MDGAFTIHPDVMLHSGATVLMGAGSIYSTPTKQKLNTKSSMEAKLVGANEVLSQVLWIIYFLEVQGYRGENLTVS